MSTSGCSLITLDTQISLNGGSFAANGVDRFNARGADGGEQRGGAGDCCERRKGAEEDAWVAWGLLLEEVGQDSGGEASGEKSSRAAAQSQYGIFAENQSDDSSARRSQRHADADLAGAAGGRVGPRALESDCGDEQSAAGEEE